MKANILLFLVQSALKLLPPDEARKAIDDLIDRIEGRGNAALDALASMLRTVLSIPDDIGGDPD